MDLRDLLYNMSAMAETAQAQQEIITGMQSELKDTKIRLQEAEAVIAKVVRTRRAAYYRWPTCVRACVTPAWCAPVRLPGMAWPMVGAAFCPC